MIPGLAKTPQKILLYRFRRWTMFNKLVASGRGRRAASSGKAMTVSIVLHGLLLASAVYASSRPPSADEAAEEEVTFVGIDDRETQPEPPAPEPPPPPTPVDLPPPPPGYQELIPPLNPPPVIPPPMAGAPAVDPADFSGIGQSGGTARGEVGGTHRDIAAAPSASTEPGFAYEVAVLDSQPALANTTDVQRALVRQYPRLLLDAGISGTVRMRFVIEPDGTVDESSLQVVSATNDQFRTAAANLVEMMRFRPGVYRGAAVRVLIDLPITFEAGN